MVYMSCANKIFDYVKVSFIVILFFSYTMAFFASFEDNILSNITDIYYQLKKVLLPLCAFTIFLPCKNKQISVLVISIGVILYLISLSFNLVRTEILSLILFDYLCCLVLFHCVVSTNVKFDSVIKILTWGARVMSFLIPFVLFFRLSVDVSYFLKSNYMFFANATMLPASIMLYSTIKNRNYFDAILAVFLCILLFLGSRGSLLSMLLLAIFLYFLKNKAFKLKNIIWLTAIVLLGCFMLDSIFNSETINISDGRAFNFFKNGTNLQDEDRFSIWLTVIENTYNPLLGGGLFFDRELLSVGSGSNFGMGYAHNVFVESYSDFGLIGLILMFTIYFRLVKSLFIPSANQFFIVTLFFVSAFQLLFSRSFLIEHIFFVLLGLEYLLYSSQRTIPNIHQ